MVLGLITLAAQVVTTMVSVLFLGWVLVIGGIAEIFYAFFSGSAGRALLFIISGLITLLVGGAAAANPGMSAVTITLLIGCYMIVVGVYKSFASLFNRYPKWGWTFASGIVTFILGGMILMNWPVSGLWIIGLFIGIELFIAGFSLTANAFNSEYVSPGYQTQGNLAGAKGGSSGKKQNYEETYENYN